MNSKWVASLIVLGVFVAGLLLGYFLPKPPMQPHSIEQRMFNNPNLKNKRDLGMQNKERDLASARILRRMVDRLELTEEQKAVFKKEITKHRKGVRIVLQESRIDSKRKVDSLNVQLNVEMEELLSEKQFKMWSRFYEGILKRRMLPPKGPRN